VAQKEGAGTAAVENAGRAAVKAGEAQGLPWIREGHLARIQQAILKAIEPRKGKHSMARTRVLKLKRQG
jgi:predicted ATPase